MKVLLVDDEVLSLEAMKASIPWKELGFDTVHTASTAREAKEIYAAGDIDLLLLDIEMPVENGLSLLAWIRRTYPERKTQAVFLTCHAKFEYAQEAIRLGCSNYLLKPVTAGDIEKMLIAIGMSVQESAYNQRLMNYGKHLYQEKVEQLSESENYISSRQAVRETTEYILNHLTEKFSVEELADRCHLSPDYLNRIFKKEHGVSVNRYIINERMYLAKELLQKNITPSVVAEMLCYESYANFVKMFKKVHGCLPSQIVAKMRTEDEDSGS